MNVTNDCYMYFTWIVTVFNVSLTFSGSDDLIRNLFPGDNFTLYISNRLGILQVVKKFGSITPKPLVQKCSQKLLLDPLSTLVMLNWMGEKACETHGNLKDHISPKHNKEFFTLFWIKKNL